MTEGNRKKRGREEGKEGNWQAEREGEGKERKEGWYSSHTAREGDVKEAKDKQ